MSFMPSRQTRNFVLHFTQNSETYYAVHKSLPKIFHFCARRPGTHIQPYLRDVPRNPKPLLRESSSAEKQLGARSTFPLTTRTGFARLFPQQKLPSSAATTAILCRLSSQQGLRNRAHVFRASPESLVMDPFVTVSAPIQFCNVVVTCMHAHTHAVDLLLENT